MICTENRHCHSRLDGSLIYTSMPNLAFAYSTPPQGAVAQLVERYVRIVEARGSIPLSSTNTSSISVDEPSGQVIADTVCTDAERAVLWRPLHAGGAIAATAGRRLVLQWRCVHRRRLQGGCSRSMRRPVR